MRLPKSPSHVEPYGLAAFRVLLGVFLLGYFLKFLPHVELLFSNQGIYVPTLLPDLAPSPAMAWGIYAVTLTAVVLLTLGYHTAVMTPLVLMAFTYHWLLSSAVRNTAYDRLIVIVLVLACFAKLDGAWSISATVRAIVPNWPARLLRLQIAVLYLGAGLWKALSPSWHTGEMLEMTLLGPWATGAGLWLGGFGLQRWVFDLMTWSVVAFELLAGFALYVSRLNRLAMVVGLGFHAGVWAFLGIPEFMVCTAVYVLFLDPMDVRKWVVRASS